MRTKKTKIVQAGNYQYHVIDDKWHCVSKNLSEGGWEIKQQGFMIANCLPGKIILDIGAQLGAHSIPLSAHCQRLVAFEPNPFFFGLLEKNIEINKIKNIIALQKGLSSKSGVTSFDENENFLWRNPSKEGDNNIQLVSGDQELKRLGIQLDSIGLIKLDAEGFEDKVLKGLEETIFLSEPIIYLEIHLPIATRDYDNFKDCKKNTIDIMQRYGYYVFKNMDSNYENINAFWRKNENNSTNSS